MENEPTSAPVPPKSALDVITKLVELLAPLEPGEQQKAMTAAMVLLGQSPAIASPKPSPLQTIQAVTQEPAGGISIKGSAWMRKNNITNEQLDHVFAIDSGCEVIASRMPGGSMRQRTVEAYVIAGLQALLQSGEPDFTDQAARSVCSKVGCYDRPNHSTYMKALGNFVSGSKEGGWKLSNPGLGRAAEIVKSLTSASL